MFLVSANANTQSGLWYNVVTDTGDWILEDFFFDRRSTGCTELPHARSQRYVLLTLYSAYMTIPIFPVDFICVYVECMYVCSIYYINLVSST